MAASVYRIIRSKRRTMALEVTPSAEVLVRAPRWVPQFVIRRFVERQQGWLEKTLLRVRSWPKAPAPLPDLLRNQRRQAYRDALLLQLRQRLPPLSAALGVSVKSFSVGYAQRRWGSCSAKGALRFNARLAMMPPEILDYVIVHELAHMREMNHSKRFWAVVAQVCPEYKERRRWLREQGHSYQV